MAEIRVRSFMYYFSWLKTPLGLSLSYFFIGFRAFGWPWWGYIIMGLAFFPGFVYLFVALSCTRLYTKEHPYDPEEDQRYQGLGEDDHKDGAQNSLMADDILAQAALNAGAAALHNPVVQNAVKSQLAAEVGMPLPDGWSVRTDQGSQVKYFVNDRTGETTWEHPGLSSA